MPNYPQQAISWTLDLIFPKVCLGCGKLTGKSDFDYVCRKCFGGIDLKNTFECIGCKRQTEYGLTCTFCGKENKIDQLLIAVELTNPLVEKMLKAYKYKFVYNVAVPLSVIAKKCIKKLLSKGFSLFESNPLLVPMPLHKRRLNERGFNQAELLAKNIADTYHVFYNRDVLTRVANPKHQADIKTREDRINNVKNKFAIKDGKLVRDRTVILVDDICTTGATLNECAKVLKESGARRVIGFVIARGQFKKN